MNFKPPTDSVDDQHPLNTVHRPRSRPRFHFTLQGRVVLTFLVLLSAALGSSCWLFATQSSGQLSEMIGQQARLIAYTLSLSTAPSMTAGKRKQLDEIGKDLLNSRSVLFVAFLDANQKPISLANRYEDFNWKDVSPINPDTESLYVAHPRSSSSFGDYVDVYAPVYANKPAKSAADLTVTKKDTDHKPLGYVIVGVSLDHEQAQLYLVNWMVAGIGVIMVVLSLPIAYLLVYGIFKPIRQLVDATRKISAGRLDFKVDVDRDDSIGELAVSFSDMVARVRHQREDLAHANSQLAEANENLAISNAKLSEANTALEQKVQQRTIQLETANRRLTSEIDEKEDFLRAVSHDLNAPLRNIAGMAGMLLVKHREKFDQDVIHRLERIQKNVEVETDLISELLELSRIKTRRQTMEKVDPAAIVRDLEGVLEEDLRSKAISLIIDTPLPALTAERARIRQVFQNLIDNAIKYMGDRPVKEIHVGAVPGADETRFYVRDTGIGIAADEVDKVFHIFRRGHSAEVQKVPGKGVGLSSVKTIVEMYSGSIWVESKLGEGSSFIFTINGKYVGEKSDAAAALEASSGASLGAPPIQPMRNAA
jgi:signal transduction histidine kinase